MDKVFYGIVAMISFYIFNFLLMLIFEKIFPNTFTYAGVVTLCGVIIVCTCIIVEKLNKIIHQLNDQNNKNN
ncbi:hypothetical protein psyc5s11_24830 [Clostridium gelidum]|uniref:Uncharacterized protein n=1 Tax=Clostridium gelidum TaxID=704125 RepID=A0ABM7T3C6_9CLOT|nr:hypothetical protein [Clostridium gelidum]BCZ46416.1 hypothetical protein psyc5s11_24830 [Clostridium gelidum]